MANYRNISVTFWTDSKVDDEFTPEDKYFYLYLLTNPHTNICGCYEISMNQMERETGYNSDTVKRLLKRMQKTHEVIQYCEETKEILIINWCKYNWTGSDNVKKAVLKVSEYIKSDRFRKYVTDTVSIGYPYHMETSVSDTDTDTDSVTDTDTDSVTDPDTDYRNILSEKTQRYTLEVTEIVLYLNEKARTKYRAKTESTRRHIVARLNDGFSVEDFKEVIDKKCADWMGTDYQKYLRPETLFGSKFESYLNEKKSSGGRESGDWEYEEKDGVCYGTDGSIYI